MTAVHVVVPDGVYDPARPSGGNTYDRRVCAGLRAHGWSVHEHAVAGNWPLPDAAALAGLGAVLEQIPNDAVVLVDGLIASTVPEVLVPLAPRLRLVVLLHMPLGGAGANNGTRELTQRERAVLAAATAVITTSAWARRRVLELYPLDPERVHVAEPAVDPADLAPGTDTGGALLCVAPVTFGKGHDVLLDALATVSELPWQCVCVGSLDREPGFAAAIRRRSADFGLADRVDFPGPLSGEDLDRAYAAADLLVLPSRAETFGMVVTEALARGVPAIASNVGGVSEALGYGAGGIRPGLLVPPDDPAALGAALGAWLADAELRKRLRRAADERRASLPDWSSATLAVADVLAGAL